jgi:hypothetical protein
MSLLQTATQLPTEQTRMLSRWPWLRPAVLCSLLLLSIILSLFLIGAVPQDEVLIGPFLRVWTVSFLPYFAACAFVLLTRPAVGRWRWIELGIILVGALILRAMLLPLPPLLSRDSWRYLWDARVTLAGFSPYVYRPVDPALHSLVDPVLFFNSRFRTAPTIYPPGAQAIFLLSYLIAPSNLFFLKGIFLVFDMVTCGALVVLLQRKGLDARRVLIYAWCPLPIIEFAMQGHVDVITLTFTILAVLSLANTSVRGRVLTGILIGIATLTKIYPILLLVAVVPDLLYDDKVSRKPFFRRLRRRDYALPAVCFGTIILGYLPYLILGHGQAFGYFATYASQQGQNAGVTQQVVQWLGARLRLYPSKIIEIEHIVAFLFIAGLSLVVFVLRLRNRMSRETAVLLLFGAVLSVSSHVFPWYTTALLLWIPVLLGPFWTRGRPVGKGLAIAATWYFTCASLIGYFINLGPGNPSLDWTGYYWIVYTPVMVALGVAAIMGTLQVLKERKTT